MKHSVTLTVFYCCHNQHGQVWLGRYETAYVARTGGRTDGCLTFWRRGRFAALRVDPLQLRRAGLKDNVALLVLLADRERPPDAPALLVGNTHLLFNPKRGDIKVLCRPCMPP